MRRTLLLLSLLAALAHAKNVDLVTLPDRTSVQLTIYNSEDLTLVRETRYLTLKRGPNQLQFAWAGTLIDPTSVELRPLEHKDDIEIADTVFPGQKPQHLLWNIESRFEGQVKVEVVYFTSGLTWSMDYVATTTPREDALDFDGHVRVFNQSGEEYGHAEIRLIVGRINLVEKIADLARRQGIPMPEPQSAGFGALRERAAKAAFAKAEEAQDALGKRQVVKEGLSEYFMFTVEGAQTIANGWSKRMPAVEARGVPFAIVYRLRPHQYGPAPVRFFTWRNDEEHRLGGSPLPDGKVRVFRDNGREGLGFLGEQMLLYVPIKAPIEVNLGPDDLVVCETLPQSTQRFDFHFDRHNNVSGWDERTQWTDTVRNYRDRPVAFELQRVWEGDVEYASEMATTLFDFRTVEAKFTVAPRDRVAYPATVTRHLGSNQRQQRVELR